MTRMTATEVVRQFSDLLNRTVYRGESFEVERNGQVVARITPAKPVARTSDLLRLLTKRSGDPTFADDLERHQAEINKPVIFEDPWER
jgi:antitoxin (DNA-binding transcriptional repressor) of toxin-antitoxin stability system